MCVFWLFIDMYPLLIIQSQMLLASEELISIFTQTLFDLIIILKYIKYMI